MNKSTPTPCIVRDAGSAILAEDDSLAENLQRVALHPLDQFRAKMARAKKRSPRLKLASAAPALLDVYSEDGMALEHLMVFTVNRITSA